MGTYKLDLSNRPDAPEIRPMENQPLEKAYGSPDVIKRETTAGSGEKPDIAEDIRASYDRLCGMMEKAALPSSELVHRLRMAQDVRWEADKLRRRIDVTDSQPSRNDVDLLHAYADVEVWSILTEHRVRQETIDAGASHSLAAQMMAQAKTGSSGVSDLSTTRRTSQKDQWMAEFKGAVMNEVRGTIEKEMKAIHAALGLLQNRMDDLEGNLGVTTRSLDTHISLSDKWFHSLEGSLKYERDFRNYDTASLWDSASHLEQRIDILQSHVLTGTFDGGINHFHIYCPNPKADYYKEEQPYYEEPDDYYEEENYEDPNWPSVEYFGDPGWPSDEAWGDEFAAEDVCEEVDSGLESANQVSEDYSGSVDCFGGTKVDNDNDSGEFDLDSPFSQQSSISLEDTAEQHEQPNEKGECNIMDTCVLNAARTSGEYEEDDVFFPAEDDSWTDNSEVATEKVESCIPVGIEQDGLQFGDGGAYMGDKSEEEEGVRSGVSVGIQTEDAEHGDDGVDKGRSFSGLVSLLRLLVMIWMALTMHEVSLKGVVVASVTGISEAGGCGCAGRSGLGVERGLDGF